MLSDMMDQEPFYLEALDWEYVLQAQDEKRELEAMVLEVVNQLLETAVHQAQEMMVIKTQNTHVNPLLPSPALVAHLPPLVQRQHPFCYESHEEYRQAQEQGQAYPPPPKRLRVDTTVDERFEEFWREFVQGKIIR
jgi:hypothetical protein